MLLDGYRQRSSCWTGSEGPTHLQHQTRAMRRDGCPRVSGDDVVTGENLNMPNATAELDPSCDADRLSPRERVQDGREHGVNCACRGGLGQWRLASHLD